MLKNFPSPLKYFAFLFAATLGIFAAYRFFFSAAYLSSEWSSVWKAASLTGAARLDLAAAAMVVLPVVFLSLPLFLKSRWDIFPAIVSLSGVFLLTFAFVISVTSFIFYGERSKPLEEEFFVFMGTDLWPALAGAWDAHPALMALSMAALVFLWYGLFRISVRILSSSETGFPSKAVSLAAWLAVVALLVALGRGVRTQPLRTGQILTSGSVISNHAAANPIFNIFVDGLASWMDRGNYIFYEDGQALAASRRMLTVGKETFDSDVYPLLRTLRSGRERSLRNVIILQLEGFSNGFIGYRREGRLVAPFLTALAEGNVYFPFFIQNVRFTHRALFAVNTGYLDRATDRSVLRSPDVRRSYSSLAGILEGEGYSPIYVEGGDSTYKEMKGFLEMEGYAIFDGPVMEESGRYDNIGDGRDAFGFHDEFAFDEALYRFREARQPFLGYVMLHSTHSPWEPPSHFESSFESPYGVFEYVDHAVREFFEGLEAEGLLESSYVIITADHTSLPVRDLSRFDRMNIPLIITGPDLGPETRKTVGSQVDLLPTVLGLLGLDVPYASLGRDLMQVPEKEGFACSLYSGHAFWYEGDVILQDWFVDHMEPKLFDRDRPQWEERDRAGEEPALVEEMQRRLRSYYQTARILSLEDRIFPR